MTDITTALVFATVVIARLGVPLFIPRYPLPGILAALLLDAVDQTIFQIFTTSDLAGYQSYDKALDVYYLAIAYISTFRNWANEPAFLTSRFLWYYRLVGVAAFELFSLRPLLLVFPNTFEYFFIFYSAVSLLWDPTRLPRPQVFWAASGIWLFIKLPQEYWIHVARLDTTDLIKVHVLGVTEDTGWLTALGENLWLVPALALGSLVLLWLRGWVMRKLPPADWDVLFDLHRMARPALIRLRPLERQPRSWLIEKMVLVGLVTIIFAQTLPGVGATTTQIVAAVAAIIVANAVVSHWLARRGTEWKSTLVEFAVMYAVNLGISVLYVLLVPFTDVQTGLVQILVLTLLLTLIVTLYDHYRPVHERHAAAWRESATVVGSRSA